MTLKEAGQLPWFLLKSDYGRIEIRDSCTANTRVYGLKSDYGRIEMTYLSVLFGLCIVVLITGISAFKLKSDYGRIEISFFF